MARRKYPRAVAARWDFCHESSMTENTTHKEKPHDLQENIMDAMWLYEWKPVGLHSFRYFTSRMSSSASTSFCSPVLMFLSVSLPAAISFSPARATYAMPLALA